MQERPITSRRGLIAAGLSIAVLIASALVFSGLRVSGSKASVQPAGPQATAVPVITIEQTQVATWDEFSGRLEAVERVDVRSRVAGAVKSVHFVEGALVKQGDLLVRIDSDPYAAEVARAKAQVVAAQARLAFTSSEHERAKRLWNESAIAQRELDERVNAARESDANLRAAEAALQSAQLNLGYTEVRAPVSGRVGKLEVTAGNLVAAGPGSPVLTTLVSVNPIYASFDADEIVVARALRETSRLASIPVEMETITNGGTRLRRRSELEHALAVLVGEVASQFELAIEEWKTRLPVIPAGVPGTVLARRPDVSAAQNSMLAAQTRVGVAQAAWFPNVALTGRGGFASPELGDLFKWSARSWLIGGLLALPLFDGGRRQAGIDSANAEFDGALIRYREQILVAFKEVEDQLAALRLLAEQAEAQDRAVTSANRSTSLSEARYRNGYVSQLDLLDAQRSELRNRRQEVQIRSAQYQATVALVRALGGGWEASLPDRTSATPATAPAIGVSARTRD